MSGLGGAGVKVPIVFWKKVHVVEDVALVIIQLPGLHKSYVHQHGAVEPAFASLREKH